MEDCSLPPPVTDWCTSDNNSTAGGEIVVGHAGVCGYLYEWTKIGGLKGEDSSDLVCFKSPISPAVSQQQQQQVPLQSKLPMDKKKNYTKKLMTERKRYIKLREIPLFNLTITGAKKKRLVWDRLYGNEEVWYICSLTVCLCSGGRFFKIDCIQCWTLLHFITLFFLPVDLDHWYLLHI